MPQIGGGRIWPRDCEVRKKLNTCGVYLRFGAHKKATIISGFGMCEVLVHFLVYLGSIRRIHKSEPCISQIELACHS